MSDSVFPVGAEGIITVETGEEEFREEGRLKDIKRIIKGWLTIRKEKIEKF